MTDTPYYATDLVPKAKLTPLQKLAWTELSEEEWLDKVAPEVWKAPVLRRTAAGPRLGRCGVSPAKVLNYISTYGSHFRGAKRQQIKELLLDRADKLLHERCCEWALEAFQKSGYTVSGLPSAVSSVVPEGCRQIVLDTFSASLRACALDITRALKSRKFRPAT